jgi:hypothetical protein
MTNDEVDDKEFRGVMLTVPAVQIDFTPYYMATIACDIFHAAKIDNKEYQHTWYKYFLYCVSIELGLKATLLNNNNTSDRKDLNIKIRHDLIWLRKEVTEQLVATLFDASDEKVIDQISPFFRSKSLEYVSGELLQAIISGGKGLPSIVDLEATANKVIEYLKTHRHFVNSDTSY